MDDLAYRITPSNAHTLGIISGYGYVVMNANVGWIVYRAISNRYRWMIMPEAVFVEQYSYLTIKEI